MKQTLKTKHDIEKLNTALDAAVQIAKKVLSDSRMQYITEDKDSYGIAINMTIPKRFASDLMLDFEKMHIRTHGEEYFGHYLIQLPEEIRQAEKYEFIMEAFCNILAIAEYDVKIIKL